MPSTRLVQQISMAAAVPANRPIDHVRRIGTGMFTGTCFGTVATVLFGGVDHRILVVVEEAKVAVEAHVDARRLHHLGFARGEPDASRFEFGFDVSV